MRIAVVRNDKRDGVIAPIGRPSPERYGRTTVNRVVASLCELGHTVACLEGDTTLFTELERFLQGDGNDGTVEPGLVLNMAYGIQGDDRYTHVPAMLEMAGVPYTGASPLGHGVSLDKVIAKVLMAEAGVATPRFAVMTLPGEPLGELRFPLIVKPRHESTSYGLSLVHDRAELDAAVSAIVLRHRQGALVEEYIDGREICIGLLGNGPPQLLPAVELDFRDRDLRLMTKQDKFHDSGDEPTKICPAPLEPELLRRAQEMALATFEACHARDYARVDIRLGADGPSVLEINSMASLGGGGSFVCAAQAAGLTFTGLIERIVEVACARQPSAVVVEPAVAVAGLA